MKKTKLLCVMSTLFMIASCTNTKFKDEWSFDSKYHWHASENGSEKSNYGKHSFDKIILENGKLVGTCSTCGQKLDYDADGVGDFYDVTKFNNPIEIHTADQKEYLSYTGEYKTIPTTSYPDGRKTNSNPVQVANQDVEATKATVTWDYYGHNDNVTYSVSIATKADFSDGFEIKGTNEKSIDLYNLFLGTNYYRVNAYEGDDITSSGTYVLNVDTTYPRNLYVGTKMTNCRDMGGRVLPSGGTIRQGLLYRTCGNGYNQDGVKIDDEGKDIMLNQLKVKSEIVLHNDDGFNFNLEGTTVYKNYMDYKGSTKSKHHFSRNTENVINTFKILADKDNYPVYYHCRIGTDRTGLIAILVNGLLGVELNEIYQDYLFSNFGKIGEKRYIGSQAGQDDISVYISEIEAAPGKNFQEKVYNVLLSIGVTKETLAAVIDNLVEGDKPVNDNGQIAVSPDKMTINGATVAHEDKSSLIARNAPEYSVTMGAGVTAEAKFNVTKAGDKAVYAYLGHSDQSDSKTIGASLSVTVDGNALTIPTLTFSDAGFGSCSGNRTNYYFVKLGDAGELTAGEHTVVVTGVANDVILGNLALVC